MSRKTGCPYIGCEDPKDKKLKDGFCTEHCYEWRKSGEFGAALKDDRVAFAASLRITSMLNTALRPFKKRWLKRMEQEGEA